MAQKDPAALIYVANFLLLIKRLRPHETGWLTILALHQYWDEDRSLPDDIDELGALCNVRMSEAETFKRCWEETFKRMFERKENGRLYSSELAGIIKSRKEAENQANNNNKSGRVSFFSRELREKYTQDENLIAFLKRQVNFDTETNVTAKFVKETFECHSKLYKKVNINTNINTDITEGMQGEPVSGQTYETYKSSFENDYNLDQTVVASCHFNPENLVQARMEFWAERKFDWEMITKPYNDIQTHFIRWCKLNKDRIKKRANEQTGGNRKGSNTDDIVSAARTILSGDTG